MDLNKFPESHTDLLHDESRAYAYLATIMHDGTPQVTPIWFNTDEKHILINSTKGRVKDINMRERPKVALMIHDPKNSYRYVQIRGTVVEISGEGARQHINDLSLKYTGNASYTLKDPDEVRLIYKLHPDKVQVSG
jgi:PPOX class probable F420-dependent enzyme